jgi:hypothetical protein
LILSRFLSNRKSNILSLRPHALAATLWALAGREFRPRPRSKGSGLPPSGSPATGSPPCALMSLTHKMLSQKSENSTNDPSQPNTQFHHLSDVAGDCPSAPIRHQEHDVFFVNQGRRLKQSASFVNRGRPWSLESLFKIDIFQKTAS